MIISSIKYFLNSFKNAEFLQQNLPKTQFHIKRNGESHFFRLYWLSHTLAYMCNYKLHTDRNVFEQILCLCIQEINLVLRSGFHIYRKCDFVQDNRK